MKLPDFKLERYFAKYEFNAPHLLCCSDCESFTIKEILSLEGESAFERFQNQWLGYTEAPGNPELRQTIADIYTQVSAENVLVTSGAEEAIFLFMNAALEKKDHIIVQYPCYQSLIEVASSIGCEVTRWEMQEKDNWELDLDFLSGSLRPNTRAIIINAPHNPTGYTPSVEKWNVLIELARSRNIVLFSDEVYRFLEYNAADRLPAACDLYENAVSLGVMSKTYGLAGLRIGWIATRNGEIYRRMASFKDYTSICNSAPSEFLSLIALKHRDKLACRNLDIIQENLLLLDQFFTRYSDKFLWQKPKAGPIAFPSIRWEASVEDFCLDLVQKKGVLLLPSNYYDFGQRNFRIGFGRKNLPQCLDKLDQYMQENKE
ncbi:aminotransferase class I/II-fold pyridoxal phosphate-dependent enzyme [Desulforamulus ruminis]|uniref:Aminotransferase class I and II n=1 Tax=Desulforamulus ruminis (strain ATCC 23193 / DSM 2154 / NCIMB 8452 / DL) TaxID=696281 RepID=F6DU14_DESRL|nr:aminotransferase class I/II-fold pyridoxal phosphate-dependent enzyme [Desulforamulus ruminis]AEG60089.1 aminotransferase class I and II [Desulforamulus ruminis DSM 2154]